MTGPELEARAAQLQPQSLRMGHGQKLFWFVLISAFALFAFDRVASVVQVTVRFGKSQPKVIRLEAPSLEEPILRALPR